MQALGVQVGEAPWKVPFSLHVKELASPA